MISGFNMFSTVALLRKIGSTFLDIHPLGTRTMRRPQWDSSSEVVAELYLLWWSLFSPCCYSFSSSVIKWGWKACTTPTSRFRTLRLTCLGLSTNFAFRILVVDFSKEDF